MLWRNKINMALLIDGLVLALTHQLIDYPQLSFPKLIFFLLVYLPRPCLHTATTQKTSVQGVGFITPISVAA